MWSDTMERAAGGEHVGVDEPTLRQRVRDLEAQVQSQAREIRALEKIEGLQDRTQALETENRALRERVAELHTFLNLSKTLAATLKMEELFRLALHLIGRALRVDAYALLLLDEAGERLVVKAAFGVPEEGAGGLSLRVGEGISGLVAQTGQAMLVPDISREPRCREQEAFRLQRGAFICVPLRLQGGEVIGVLNAVSSDWNALDTEMERIDKMVSGLIRHQRRARMEAWELCPLTPTA